MKEKTTNMSAPLQNFSYVEYDYGYTEFGNSAFFRQYVDWGQTLFQFIFPFFGLCILNSLIALKVSKL